MQGLSFDRPELASATAELARERNLVIETAGPNDEVLKFFPPLTITFDELAAGLEIVEDSLREVLDEKIISPIAAE
jgi:diaminobutyrate-2-oxoglutarate transaminase